LTNLSACTGNKGAASTFKTALAADKFCEQLRRLILWVRIVLLFFIILPAFSFYRQGERLMPEHLKYKVLTILLCLICCLAQPKQLLIRGSQINKFKSSYSTTAVRTWQQHAS
jgi:hypothetical protein